MTEVQRYTLTAIVLHWAIALMVFVLIGVGWYMDDLPKGPDRGWYFALHKNIGISLFLLLLLRVIWRATHRPPPLPDLPAWNRNLARANHFLLYALLFIQPVSGYISSSFSGHKGRYFGMELPYWGWKDETLNDIFSTLHEISSKVLLALVAFHLLGAIMHRAYYRDSTMRRMLP